MTVVNLQRDDLGVQRLQGASAARNVTAPASPPPAGLMAGYRPASSFSPAAPPEERRRGERRRGQERRAQHRAVLLDTRSHYERRTQERRQHSAPQGAWRTPLGINVYI